MAFDQDRLTKLIATRDEIEDAMRTSADFNTLVIRNKTVQRDSALKQLEYLKNEIRELESLSPSRSGPAVNQARILR